MTETMSGAQAVAGIQLGCAAAGIRYQQRDDLVVMMLEQGSSLAAVFTRNAFCAAPVLIARQHLQSTGIRYLLINSGNANAGTGADGLAAAKDSCALLAESTACEAEHVLPFSTGVIGECLPLAAFESGIPVALQDCSEQGWERAARAIMTTDTRPKLRSARITLSAGEVTLTGMAKGAGMIRPDMATMLAFIATDAAIDADRIQDMLQDSVNCSFNRISVDGDTSTNDACVLVASGASAVRVQGEDVSLFQQALDELCTALARDIARDGEGATKLINILVRGGLQIQECEQIGQIIAASPLVKTAFFAGDPNWGRILAAVGRAGLKDLEVSRIQIWLDELCIVEDGGRCSSYTEQAGQEIMQREEITICIDLGRGNFEATTWTCDLSYDYVRINAEYRT